MVLNNSPVSTQIHDRLRSKLYLHHLHRITVPSRYQKGHFMANNRPMTEDEKKLLQAQHRRQRHRKNIFANVARKNVALLLMNLRLLRQKAGRNNICISSGRKRSIYPRLKPRKSRTVSERQRHLKAPAMGDKTLLQSCGTAKNSYLHGVKAGK